MAQTRDIRQFFRPATKPAAKEPALRDPSAPRIWPTPRTEALHGEASSQTSPTPSPTLAVEIPSKQPPVDSKQISSPTTTTAPPLSASQSSTNSGGSKKTTVDGKQVVLNSDSDTDSDMLEELDFGPKRSSPQIQVSNDAATTSRHGSTRLSRSLVKDLGLRRPSNIHKVTKPSLSRLVQAAKKDAEIEQKIAAAKLELDKKQEMSIMPALTLNEESLAGVIKDDEEGDKAQRLYLAMQRTQALDLDTVFHFINDKPNALSSHKSQLPLESLPKHAWTTNFKDSLMRDQSFLSGFARQIFQHQALPEELASWILDQICYERSDALNAQYVQILDQHQHHLKIILNEDTLESIFLGMGINTQCLQQPILPALEPRQNPKRPLPPSLRWLLQLLRNAGQHLSPNALEYALVLILHLAFDDSILSDPAMQGLVQDAIETIISKLPDPTVILKKTTRDLLSRITHPVLQNNLVLSLPTKSPLTATFRQQLALAFLLYPTPLDTPVSSPGIAAIIHNYLDGTSHFNITRDTNYSDLAARLSLLDVGIGPGPTTVPDPRSPEPLYEESKSPIPIRLSSLSTEEIAFNKEVDTLAKRVRLLSNKIVEAGAISDLTRLDAKDGSEKLCHRLEDAVRIGGRKKINIFEDENAAEVKSKRFFGKWLGKKSDSSTKGRIVNGAINGGEGEENYFSSIEDEEYYTGVEDEDNVDETMSHE